MNSKLSKYYNILSELRILGGISGLLSWDQETKMPVKNTDFRAEQRSYISLKIHEKVTSKEYIKTVNELFEDKDKLDPIDKRSVEVSKRSLDRSLKLPKEFVEEFSKTTAKAHELWIKAKSQGEFKQFSPILEKIVDLKIKEAELVDSSKPIYDVLLDEYEEDMTSSQIDKIFVPLKEELTAMLKDIRNKETKNIPEIIKFDKYKAQELIDEIVKAIGFDFERGATAEVHHPFETSLAPNDIRINMSYYHNDLMQSITGAIHELGHGLYEQNIDPKYNHTDLSTGVSLGIHESQSRLLENMIGRSIEFSNFLSGKINQFFPEANEISSEDYYNYLNKVNPSLIRIEADEVTYNLHIIIRYEIEKMMLEKKIKTEELPEVWNQKYKDYLGITPDSDSKGCLQDVHWSLGAIGYFPTYTLGNLNAGQLWRSFVRDHPNWDTEVSSGNFTSYYEWFKNKIWQHGSFYKPEELITNITGEKFEAKYLIQYLSSKYGRS